MNGKDLKQARASAGVEKSSPAIAAQGSESMGVATATAPRKKPSPRNMEIDLLARKFCRGWTGCREERSVSGVLSSKGYGV